MKAVQDAYGPLLAAFARELAPYPLSDYAGIPHPFLPQVGRNYWLALRRIAVVGKETRGWDPPLDAFLASYRREGFDFAAEMAAFRSLAFKDSGWMGDRPTRASFWGFWMNVLAKLYGVDDWEAIKRGEHDALLDGFVWGNVNAIETPTSACVNARAPGYCRAKVAAERLFDSAAPLVRALKPHALVLLCAAAERDRYLGPQARLVERAEGRIAVYRLGDVVVFHAPHPNNQRYHAGGAEAYARLLRRLLSAYGMFCPLPNTFGGGLAPEARQALVRALAGVGTFDAVAAVALELRRQRAVMTARSLCLDVLNPAGLRTRRGEPFTGNGKGPCRLVAAAWNHFQASRPDVAESIALAFTDIHGTYAYAR